MCFHFTAGTLFTKKIVLEKKNWHLPLCDPLSKVNMYIENIFSKLLVAHTANNFLLICLNLASVFSSVSHSTDVFSIWRSKIQLLHTNRKKGRPQRGLNQQSLSYLRGLSILLISLRSTILRNIDKHTQCFSPLHFIGQIKPGCLKEKVTNTSILLCMYKILWS